MNEESAHEDTGYSRKKPWRGVQGYCQLLGCAPVFQGLKAVNDYSSYTGLILGSLQPVALPAPRDPNALYQQADVGGRMILWEQPRSGTHHFHLHSFGWDLVL